LALKKRTNLFFSISYTGHTIFQEKHKEEEERISIYLKDSGLAPGLKNSEKYFLVLNKTDFIYLFTKFSDLSQQIFVSEKFLSS